MLIIGKPNNDGNSRLRNMGGKYAFYVKNPDMLEKSREEIDKIQYTVCELD